MIACNAVTQLRKFSSRSAVAGYCVLASTRRKEAQARDCVRRASFAGDMHVCVFGV